MQWGADNCKQEDKKTAKKENIDMDTLLKYLFQAAKEQTFNEAPLNRLFLRPGYFRILQKYYRQDSNRIVSS